MIRLLVVFLACLLAPSLLPAQEMFTYVASDADVNYDPDNGAAAFDVTVSIYEDEESPTYPSDTAGFQMGLAHDAEILTILDAVVSGDLASIKFGDGPDFFAPDLEPGGDGTGVVLGVVYSLTADVNMAFDEEKNVLTLSYETVPTDLIDAVKPTVTELEWVDDLGDPIIINSMVVSGLSEAAGGANGVVTLTPLVLEFKRGDVDGNGVVFGLIDAIALLEWIFVEGAEPPCLDAADADDSGVVSALIDGAFLFEYQFTNGDLPPDPGLACGEDPTDDDVECEIPLADCE